MENTHINKETTNDIGIYDKNIINLVKNQTNYSESEIKKYLKLYNNDHIKVIKNYLQINDTVKKERKKTTNQEIMSQIRDFMDKKNPPQKAGDNDNEIKVLVTIKGNKVTAELVVA